MTLIKVNTNHGSFYIDPSILDEEVTLENITHTYTNLYFYDCNIISTEEVEIEILEDFFSWTYDDEWFFTEPYNVVIVGCPPSKDPYRAIITCGDFNIEIMTGDDTEWDDAIIEY